MDIWPKQSEGEKKASHCSLFEWSMSNHSRKASREISSEIFFAWSPPKLSPFKKIVTNEKRFAGTSEGVAVLKIIRLVQVKWRKSILIYAVLIIKTTLCCSESIQFTEDKAQLQGNNFSGVLRFNFILKTFLGIMWHVTWSRVGEDWKQAVDHTMLRNFENATVFLIYGQDSTNLQKLPNEN